MNTVRHHFWKAIRLVLCFLILFLALFATTSLAEQTSIFDGLPMLPENMTSLGGYHGIYLRTDGTVFAVGANWLGQCDVGDWSNIIAVAAGHAHSVGLRADGTVVATGDNTDGECNVDSWTDIVAISAGSQHTVGLKRDGTVVATGSNEYGQCNVKKWKKTVKIDAGSFITGGVTSSGKALAVGANDQGQCNVKKWKNIIDISTGRSVTAGLKKDGTVVYTGPQNNHRMVIQDWKDIVQMDIESNLGFGLTTNGTLFGYGEAAFKDVVSLLDHVAAINVGTFDLSVLLDNGCTAFFEGSGKAKKAIGETDVKAIASGPSVNVILKNDGRLLVYHDYHYLDNVILDGWGDVVKIDVQHQSEQNSVLIAGLTSQGTLKIADVYGKSCPINVDGITNVSDFVLGDQWLVALDINKQLIVAPGSLIGNMDLLSEFSGYIERIWKNESSSTDFFACTTKGYVFSSNSLLDDRLRSELKSQGFLQSLTPDRLNLSLWNNCEADEGGMLKLYDMTTKEVASTQLSSSPKKILLGWLDSSAYALLENGEVAVLSLYPNPVIQQRLESINTAHDLIDIAVGDCLLGLRSDGVVVGIDFSCIGGAFDLTKQGSASFK